MNTKNPAYKALFALSKKVRLLDSISYLLEWDHETYMPAKGNVVRADQLELMASLAHKDKTSKKFETLLGRLIDIESGKILAHDLTPQEMSAAREWRRDFIKARALPNRFVKKFAKSSAEAHTTWAEARKSNRFSHFKPDLEKMVLLSQEKAEYLGYKTHPYDALLDCFEPHTTTSQIEEIFSPVRKGIQSLLSYITQRPQVDAQCLHGNFSSDTQLKFGLTLLQAMGYDLEKGRLDLSTHPFSMAVHPSDSRITTRIHRTSVFDSLSAVLHEGGHSLYEMGLMPEYYGSPLCDTVSLGIHESQSRLWETRVGQSRPFWHFFLPLLQKEFNQLENVTLEQFYRAINKVAPTFIRVESDEVTYSLHVILRFEIEKRLISGELKVKDIPEVWNHLMQEYLGITPSTDSEGCLQDIHWSMGAFGYFPTYALGNLYASQFFDAFAQKYPDWEQRVAQGELIFLRDWLQEKIHQHGRMYSAAELVKRITGHSLSEKPYLSYLEKKYREIYA